MEEGPKAIKADAKYKEVLAALIKSVKKQLPNELRQKVTAAEGDITDIEGLSDVLRRIFREYGLDDGEDG